MSDEVDGGLRRIEDLETAIQRARAAIAFEREGEAEDVLAAVMGDIDPLPAGEDARDLIRLAAIDGLRSLARGVYGDESYWLGPFTLRGFLCPPSEPLALTEAGERFLADGFARLGDAPPQNTRGREAREYTVTGSYVHAAPTVRALAVSGPMLAPGESIAVREVLTGPNTLEAASASAASA